MGETLDGDAGGRKLACRLALALAMTLFGCGVRPSAPLPAVPEPAVEERAETLAPVPASWLALPLELDLAWLLPSLGEAVEKELRLAQGDWTRVSAEGSNPEVDTRMQARIGELRAQVRGGSVRLEVPIAYWGKVRARANTPFGSVWLSKGTDWGTPEAPGRVTLFIEVRPMVDQAFGLSTRSALVELRMEAPKGERLCTTTFVRVCVSRDDAAARVHEELEREIRERAPALLGMLDARVARQGEGLRAFLAQALAVMATPAGADQLVLQLEQLALGPFSGTDTRLRVDAELAFRVSSSAAAPRSRLPSKTDLRGARSELTFDVAVPFQDLSARCTRGLGVDAAQGWTLACDVLGNERSGPGLVLAITLRRDAQLVRVFAHALPELRGSELKLAKVRFTQESQAALSAAGVDARELEERVRNGASVSLADAAKAQLARVAQKLGALTLALTPIELQLGSAHYEALRPVGRALLLRVRSIPTVRLAPPP